MKMKTTVIFILFIFSFVGCESLVDFSEIHRYTSPDSRVDAVVVTSDAGATTSTAYHVFIVPKDATYPKDFDVSIFTADHIEGLNVYWQGAKILKVTYKTARIFKFTNFWQSRDVDNFQYIVKIIETEQGH
jgi:hypothetical protein